MDGKVSFVVYGATGVTGHAVAKDLARVLSEERSLPVPKTMAIAGRRKLALDKIAGELQDEFPDIGEIPVILADSSDTASIDSMVKRARVVLACVGPFRFFGDVVAEACAKHGVHYADTTGEPAFSEGIAEKLHETAQASGATLVTCAGFDSVPADLGTIFTKRAFADKFADKACLNGVFSSLSLSFGSKGYSANSATYESAVNGFGDVKSLREARKRAEAKLSGAGEPEWVIRPDTVAKVRPSVKVKPLLGPLSREPEELGGRYWIPFPGADASVIRRSEAELWRAHCHKNSSVKDVGVLVRGCPVEASPVHHGCYVAIESWWAMLMITIAGAILQFFSMFAWGRQILVAFPEFFTFGMFRKGGPTEEQKRAASFEMAFLAYGSPIDAPSGVKKLSLRDQVVVKTAVRGPEPGYVATPICINEVALAIVRYQGVRTKDTGCSVVAASSTSPAGNLVVPPGVFTPGAALARTDIIERLTRRGVRFECL
jgi:short subunit dehydrogenase-like uncharacterized protein